MKAHEIIRALLEDEDDDLELGPEPEFSRAELLDLLAHTKAEKKWPIRLVNPQTGASSDHTLSVRIVQVTDPGYRPDYYMRGAPYVLFFLDKFAPWPDMPCKKLEASYVLDVLVYNTYNVSITSDLHVHHREGPPDAMVFTPDQFRELQDWVGTYLGRRSSVTEDESSKKELLSLLSRPRPKKIELHARRWFRKGAGNTYHVVDVYVDGELVGTAGPGHGGGDAFAQTALNWLVAQRYLPRPPEGQPPWASLSGQDANYVQDIYYVPWVKDVKTKRELYYGHGT